MILYLRFFKQSIRNKYLGAFLKKTFWNAVNQLRGWAVALWMVKWQPITPLPRIKTQLLWWQIIQKDIGNRTWHWQPKGGKRIVGSFHPSLSHVEGFLQPWTCGPEQKKLPLPFWGWWWDFGGVTTKSVTQSPLSHLCDLFLWQLWCSFALQCPGIWSSPAWPLCRLSTPWDCIQDFWPCGILLESHWIPAV